MRASIRAAPAPLWPIAIGATLALNIAACGLLPAGNQMQLSVENEATVDVVLFVNGRMIQPVGHQSHVDVPASALPPLPWIAAVQLPTGRTLVELTVHAGDVWSNDNGNGGSEMHGDGARVDLSCGRIDIYSGPPLMGPAPGPGVPGDCS